MPSPDKDAVGAYRTRFAWVKSGVKEPREKTYYDKSIREHPEWFTEFGDMSKDVRYDNTQIPGR